MYFNRKKFRKLCRRFYMLLSNFICICVISYYENRNISIILFEKTFIFKIYFQSKEQTNGVLYAFRIHLLSDHVRQGSKSRTKIHMFFFLKLLYTKIYIKAWFSVSFLMIIDADAAGSSKWWDSTTMPKYMVTRKIKIDSQ